MTKCNCVSLSFYDALTSEQTDLQHKMFCLLRYIFNETRYYVKYTSWNEILRCKLLTEFHSRDRTYVSLLVGCILIY